MKKIFVTILFCGLLPLSQAWPALSRTINPVPENINPYNKEDDFGPHISSETKSFAVRWQDLPELGKKDFSKFKNLETVILKFTLAPHSADPQKEERISSVEKNLVHLKALRKCGALKNLVLQIGVYLFISSKDKLSYESVRKLEKEGKCGDCDKKAGDLNILRADERFRAKLQKILPGVKLYAVNWGW